MLRYFLILLCILIFFSKTYIYYMERYLGQVKTELNQALKELNLVKIEWVYLNQHAKLEELSRKFLKDWDVVVLEQMKYLPIKKNKKIVKTIVKNVIK